MKNQRISRIADKIIGSAKDFTLVKASVTATYGTPITTFDAQVGTKSVIPGISASVPFRPTLAVGSVVWLLKQGPVVLLVHQES